MFSLTLAFLVDFGMVITPLCKDQRISTCAGVFPSLLAISTTGALSKMAPLASGQYPCFVENIVHQLRGKLVAEFADIHTKRIFE